MRPFLQALTDSGFPIASPDNAFLTWCLDLGLSPQLLTMLSEGWVVGEMNVDLTRNAFSFNPPVRIREDVERHPRYLREGFFPIGYCYNGDAITLDIQTGAVVFLSHEHWWGPERENVRQYRGEVAASLDEFAGLMWSDDFPECYWSCLKRAE